MNKKNGLIVFCEGPHDVAFFGRVLKDIFKFKKTEFKFNEYPAPFDAFFSTQVKNHAQKDLSLSMAHKFFLPDIVLEKQDDIVFLFNTGGKDSIEKVKELLVVLLPLLKNSAYFPSESGNVVLDAKFLFLYDSDDLPAKSVQSNWHDKFKIIDGEQWLDASFEVMPEDIMSAKSSNSKAVYIWGGSEESGTLEDLLLPMFREKNPEQVIAAIALLEEIFKWKASAEGGELSVAEVSKFKKSVITIVGQKSKPGSSMNVVVGQGGFITKQNIESSIPAMKFCKFLKEFANL